MSIAPVDKLALNNAGATYERCLAETLKAVLAYRQAIENELRAKYVLDKLQKAALEAGVPGA